MRLNVNDWQAAARSTLPRFAFHYVDGAAEDGPCLRRNRSDFESRTLTSRVLRYNPPYRHHGRGIRQPVEGAVRCGANGFERFEQAGRGRQKSIWIRAIVALDLA